MKDLFKSINGKIKQIGYFEKILIVLIFIHFIIFLLGIFAKGEVYTDQTLEQLALDFKSEKLKCNNDIVKKCKSLTIEKRNEHMNKLKSLGKFDRFDCQWHQNSNGVVTTKCLVWK